MRDGKFEKPVQPDSNDIGGANSEQKGPLSLSGGVDKNNSSCSVVAGEKSKQMDGPGESTEFNKQSSVTSEDPEEDESDVEEEDVKVCDICGDAGREDLLAVCTRCSDGAEHTYCMRNMLDEVPEFDWLCEECKLTEEMEKRRLESSGSLAMKEGSKQRSSDSGIKMDKDLSSSRSKAVNISSGIPSKRPADVIEVESGMKKQNVESALASPSTSSSGKIVSMSRENSFKSSDKMNPKQISGCMADNLEDPRSPKANMPHAPTGTFAKSNSFGTSGSKSKVRPVDEVPQKNKEGGDGKVVGKSTSFKGNLNRSAAPESKVKMLSPEDSHILESRGLKQAKDRSLYERKNSLKSDISQLVGNAGKLQARGEAKIQNPGYSGSSSFNPADPMATDVACKETLLSSSRLEGSINSHTDRTSEKSCKSSREGTTAGTSSSNQRSVGAESSIARRLKEGASEENKLKAAIQAAMQKKLDIDKKNRTSEKPIPVPVPNMDSLTEIPSMDKLLNLTNARNFPSPGIEVPVPRSSYSLGKEASMNNSVQSKTFSANHVLTKERDWNISYYDELMLRRLVIPEQEFIWQGSFEVHRNGIPKDQICGFQAHLATTASYKVSEIAKKFPQKVSLAEVPRSRTWPTQFKDCGADEDNIAVYFFAKDFESYQKSYKYLLEKMIKDDLALIGTIDGCELLIFSSKQLIEKSQRWNMLFFLWGVFRGRRSSSWGIKSVHVDSTRICGASVREGSHSSSNLVNGNCGLRHDNNRLENQLEGDRLAEAKMGVECQQGFRKAVDGGVLSDSEAVLRCRDQVLNLEAEASSSVPTNDLTVKESGEDSCPGGSENDLKNVPLKLEEDGSRAENRFTKDVNFPEIGGKQEEGPGAVLSRLTNSGNRTFLNEQLPSSSTTGAEAAAATAATSKSGRLPLHDLNEMDVDEDDMTEDMDVDKDETSSVVGNTFTGKMCNSLPHNSNLSLEHHHLSGFKLGYDPNTAVDPRPAVGFSFPTGSSNSPLALEESLTLRVSSSSLASGNDDRSADGLPSLELALGAENKRQVTPPGGLFLNPGERDQNILLPASDGGRRLREGEKQGGGGAAAALSLSLAFPFSEKDQTSG